MNDKFNDNICSINSQSITDTKYRHILKIILSPMGIMDINQLNAKKIIYLLFSYKKMNVYNYN